MKKSADRHPTLDSKTKEDKKRKKEEEKAMTDDG
jgi:hypothetical protein